MIFTDDEPKLKKVSVGFEINSDDFQSICMMKRKLETPVFGFEGCYEMPDNERTFLLRMLEKCISCCLEKADKDTDEETGIVFHGCQENAGLNGNNVVNFGGREIPLQIS